ncbi:MAG: PQQ-binding-like beta-propeller repeat protein, partial [Planctomycetaceae bacterium]
MNRVLVICMGFVLTINPSSAQDAGWQRFRGADAAGLNTAEIPTTWNDEQNVVWKTALPGKGSSSPVVFGDRIFLTAYTGYGLDVADAGDRSQLRLHVVCLDRNSGKTLWISETEPAAEEQEVPKRVADH